MATLKMLRICRPMLARQLILQTPQRCSRQLHRIALASSSKPHLSELYASQQLTQKRCYGGGLPLDRQSIGDRILLNLRLYDKIDPETVALESRFKEDLNLDSLDHVEVIMAIEDEFGFEIPDQDAEHFLTPAHIVQYIMDKFDVLEPAH